MRIVEVFGRAGALSQRQRWSHYLTMLFAAAAILIGINLRDSALNATVHYVDSQAGIGVNYPDRWLLESSGDTIFRVRDVQRQGFKTTIAVAVHPVNPDDPNGRNILDALSLARSQTLTAYNVGSIAPYTLPDEVPAIAMNYTYVFTDPNPLLESMPIVVVGIDILTIKRGQAIVVTFQDGADTFDANMSIFNRFLESLEY